MNVCPVSVTYPGHEQSYRCRLPAGHGIPVHYFTPPPVSTSESDRLAWDIAERPTE